MLMLSQAARDGLIDIVEAHLDATAATYLHSYDEDGYTALHHAARYNRLSVVDALVKAGASEYIVNPTVSVTSTCQS